MPIKLEFFEDGYEGGPLLLLWDGSASDVSRLVKVFESLAERTGVRIALHELPFIEPTPYVAVLAVSGNHSSGVVRKTPALEWEQSLSGWDNAAGLLEPFAKSTAGGFQFLNRAGGAEVIYSTHKSW
jgi:hypothetical protein